MRQCLAKIATAAGLLGVLALAGATRVEASFDPSFVGTDAVGSNTQWDYELVFAGVVGAGLPEKLVAGDFLTLYDIPGLVSATAGPDFSVSVQNIGINAFGTVPVDDPLLPNVTFEYTGPTLNDDRTFTGFSIVSSFGTPGLGFFTSETTSNSDNPILNGTPVGHIGLTTIPAVPEPGSLALAGVGVVGLMGLRWRRRLRATA